MELKQLNKFTEEYKLEKTHKLIKYLIILGISVAKQSLNDITQDGIKSLANAYKEKSIQQEIKSLRKKVLSLEKHFQPEQQIKYHSQPKLPTKITPKITEQIPVQQNVKKAIPFKHHLDDSEIKSILWNQYNNNYELNYENKDSQHQPKRKQTFDSQPIIPQYLPRNDSQNEIQPLSQRENSARQQTQRSSYHSSQIDSLHSLHSRNSPQFKDEIKKIHKENKTPQGSSVPKHLRQVQSKIKQQILQDKEQYRSNHVQKVDDQCININNSMNPLNNTPQNKLFQPCQSTHFGSGQVGSAQQQQNHPQESNTITERKLFNIDEIASSFLNSPFLKSQIKQRLFNKQESASKSSASSTFSLFNPNNELKNFFQQLDKQVVNQLSFQF
ncbi:unnamed protein product (macronuclear) [Paramecium tetraurelia]|uniref:Uncharacterized protein n=1 Tax=Paramecium tetraurelia TaxID=5888 RepID=A0CVA7_PARTE|nr:uncharacterized protein GSPATT00010892001 [Paramecium tetraurelia]CAK74724.1 unnamed protein product [Paramecium tetraurelia]|eukprot:XP_001442121.1 hypothetical protein (macronuclear) [Paramecium tetraurelia strain d4-2]